MRHLEIENQHYHVSHNTSVNVRLSLSLSFSKQIYFYSDYIFVSHLDVYLMKLM